MEVRQTMTKRAGRTDNKENTRVIPPQPSPGLTRGLASKSKSPLTRGSPRPALGTPKDRSGATSPRTPVSVTKDTLRLDILRLEAQLKSKEQDYTGAMAEVQAQKQATLNTQRTAGETQQEVRKLKEKVQQLEKQLESKALEQKKTSEHKDAALQDAQEAEQAIRKFYEVQKGTNLPSLEPALAPLEAQLRMKTNQISRLQEDMKAAERNIRAKEAALLEAEKTVQAADAALKAMEDLRNRNQDLVMQIDSLQEEQKVMKKVEREKITEIERLSAEVAQLKEIVSGGGAAVNALLASQHSVQKLQKEKQTLEQELARTKVVANRVAIAAASEWKDDTDKVITVKRWLEERRVMQAEVKQVQDKLDGALKQIRTEEQKKERLQARLRCIEESLKGTPAGRSVIRRLSSSSKDLSATASSSGYSSSPLPNGTRTSLHSDAASEDGAPSTTSMDDAKVEPEGVSIDDGVPGALFDLLQKEVVGLRKARAELEQMVQDKQDAIEMLTRKCDTLSRSVDVEGKKSKREIAALEKELSKLRIELCSKDEEAKDKEEALKKEAYRLKAKLHALQQAA